MWRKRNKYHAVTTYVDNIRFASKKEANRYKELSLLLRLGKIKDLQLQVKFPLSINGIKICDYIADFVYEDNGIKVVEDTKGVRTHVYLLKKKLMRAIYGITITES